MRKLFVILGFFTAVIAVILAVTPLSNLSIAPAIAAFASGMAVLYISNKKGRSKKVIQYIFLLTIIAISLTIYKAVFNEVELGDTQELIDKEKVSEEEALQELDDIDFDDIEIDDVEIELGDKEKASETKAILDLDVLESDE